MELDILPDSFLSKENRVLRSSDLFGEKKLVFIHHKDDLYRLSITKQGKLILTK